MNQNKLLSEYAQILEIYLNKFGLSTIDIAYLAKVNKKTIDSVLAGSGGIELYTLEAISQVFGQRYFELGDPSFKIPPFNSLPERTKVRIAFRKQEGLYHEKSYDKRFLNEKIIIILAKYNKGDEFLSKHIVNKLMKGFQEKVNTSEVSKRLVNSLNEYISQTKKTYTIKGKRGRKPYYYRIIKDISQKDLALAKEKLKIY